VLVREELVLKFFLSVRKGVSLCWCLSVSAGSVQLQAIAGAILSYSSSASAPNLDPIAFKEAALARLRNVAVSFDSNNSLLIQGARARKIIYLITSSSSRCPAQPAVLRTGFSSGHLTFR